VEVPRATRPPEASREMRLFECKVNRSMQGLIWRDRAAAWPLWGYFSYVAVFSGVLFGGLMWLGTPEMGGLGGARCGSLLRRVLRCLHDGLGCHCAAP
jgi:hypothetical protein